MSCTEMAMKPRWKRLPPASASSAGQAMEALIMKPIPTLPPVGEKIAVLTPTTRSSTSNIGPLPELSRLIATSVCK